MIKGQRKIELTPDSILRMISEYDVYRLFFGNFKINETTYNHLRGEKDGTPSFIISDRGGNLHHYDFSAGKAWSGDCFNLVQQIHNNCSLDDALKIIDGKFGLGISSDNNVGEYKKITSQYKQPESMGKRYSIIQCITRKFTQNELKYWAEYYQTEEDLRREKIYSIKEVFLNKKRYPLGIDEIRFGYFYEGGWWKIYRPFAPKKSKWISNVPITTATGLENLCLGHNTLITKSKKDWMVCRKVYPYTCHVQNENICSFSDETVEYINSHSKGVYYNGDSDDAGKSASYIITQAFGWKHINSPDRLLPEINDMAGWARKEGLDKLELHFKEKGLIK